MNINNKKNNLIWLKEHIITPENTKITAFLTEFNNAIILFLTDKNIKIRIPDIKMIAVIILDLIGSTYP